MYNHCFKTNETMFKEHYNFDVITVIVGLLFNFYRVINSLKLLNKPRGFSSKSWCLTISH